MVLALAAFCFGAIALYVAAIRWALRVIVGVFVAVWDVLQGRVPRTATTGEP